MLIFSILFHFWIMPEGESYRQNGTSVRTAAFKSTSRYNPVVKSKLKRPSNGINVNHDNLFRSSI